MSSMDVGNIGSKDVIYIKGSSGSGAGLSFKNGDTMQARVVSSSQGSVILRIGDARIVASSTVPLEQGSTVSLMVTEVGANRIVFKQLNNQSTVRTVVGYTKDDLLNRFLEMAGVSEDKANGIIRAASNLLKGNQVDLGKAVNDLLGKLSDLPVDLPVMEQSLKDGSLNALLGRLSELIVSSGDSSKILASIKQLVDSLQHESEQLTLLDSLQNSAGQKTEQSLNNLKMLLLSLSSKLSSDAASITAAAHADDLSGMIESIEKVLQSLNAVEIANLPTTSVSPGKDSFFYLPLPIRCGDTVGTADIRIYKEGNQPNGKSGENSMITVGFALQMPTLGTTKALLEVRNDTVNYFMAIGNEEAVLPANNAREELINSLENLGYKAGAISIMHLNENTGKNPNNDGMRFSSSLIEAKMGTGFEGVDLYG